jgi:2'-hydroxyisoflavone reductase
VGVYVFTSTRSVYSNFSAVGMNEDGPTHEPDPAAIDEGRRLSYGTAKSTCEYELKRAFPDRHLVVRPGLIVGPGDPTDRFTYWPARIDRGGEVLAPGDPNNHAHFIDVRDLAEWYVHLIETDATGTFNALGPAAPLTFAEMLYGIRAITTASVSFTWVDTDFLLDREVRPYSDMPLWMPARGNRAGFQRFDLSKPLAHGIRYRPLAVTARDTLEFHRARPAERQQELRAGMDAERESKLLAEWRAAH